MLNWIDLRELFIFIIDERSMFGIDEQFTLCVDEYLMLDADKYSMVGVEEQGGTLYIREIFISGVIELSGFGVHELTWLSENESSFDMYE